MKASLLLRERVAFEDGTFAEMVVWQLPESIPLCRHKFKYRFAYIVEGMRVLGYDNERGKGDHRHWQGKEKPYIFTSIEALMADFLADIQTLRRRL